MADHYKKVKQNGKLFDEHRVIYQKIHNKILLTDECVHHINGDIKDNRPENLELISRSEHSRMHMSGERNNSAVLSTLDVETIRKSNLPTRILANMFSVSRYTIIDARKGRTWNNVTVAPRKLKNGNQWTNTLKE